MLQAFAAAARRIRTYLAARGKASYLTVGNDVHIGARCRLWAPKHIVLADHVYVGKDVHIEANCRIGRFCLLANRVAIVGRRDHDFRAVGYPVRYAPSVRSLVRPSASVREEVVIEDDVWVGFGAILLTGISIGRGAVVAAGSVVTRDVAPYTIVGGSPARELGRRFEDGEAIATHESAIHKGRFRLSERGYDLCTVEPYFE